MDTLLTAEVYANSPRWRRKSSVFVDGIHDSPGTNTNVMAPAQLYSTESGHLFHSGRIVIATVGLPARGKTHISVAVARYLRWLGVKTHVFHLGDYRRATIGPGAKIPDDYFLANASPSSVLLRTKILRKCREDIINFLDNENGQVAIFDAVNPLAAGRRALANEFEKRDIQTIFFESFCDDDKIIEANVRSVKISSPDYAVGWSDDDAIKDYLARIQARIPIFESMAEPELHWIKMVNAGDMVHVNECKFGYLPPRLVFYILNLHIKTRYTYFARAGTTAEEESYKADATLSEEGREYAKRLGQALSKHREQERKAVDAGGPGTALKPLTIWTSARRRTVETASHLVKYGYSTKQRTQLTQMRPGALEKLTEAEILEKYRDEVAKHKKDPYHHRYPRAESYHDLAVRLEPIIFELEREQNDLLIIAHESVLRVLYGYLMACNSTDIPKIQFFRNEIVKIIPASYCNLSKRIPIPGLPADVHPSSPTDIEVRVPPPSISVSLENRSTEIPTGIDSVPELTLPPAGAEGMVISQETPINPSQTSEP